MEKFLNDKKEEILSRGFKPIQRGLHTDSAIRAYTELFHANDSVLQLLTEGYRPRWMSSPPPPTVLQNNKSAMRNLPFVRTTISEWMKQGFVTKTDQAPRIISPLSVDTKTDVLTGKLLCIFLKLIFMELDPTFFTSRLRYHESLKYNWLTWVCEIV